MKSILYENVLNRRTINKAANLWVGGITEQMYVSRAGFIKHATAAPEVTPQRTPDCMWRAAAECLDIMMQRYVTSSSVITSAQHTDYSCEHYLDIGHAFYIIFSQYIYAIIEGVVSCK